MNALTKPNYLSSLLFNDFSANSIDRMFSRFDKMFREFVDIPFVDSKLMGSGFPSTDIIYNKDKKRIEYILEVSGWKKEDISIRLMEKEGCLKVSGAKNESLKREGEYLLKQIKKSSWKKILPLPENADLDKMEAEINGGELFISIPINIEESKELAERTVPIK